jgi:hypothetical protein
MVDFKEILCEHLAWLTPEELERHEAWLAREAAFEATAEPIEAVFERLAFRSLPAPRETLVPAAAVRRRLPVRTETVPVKPERHGTDKEVYTKESWTLKIRVRLESRAAADGHDTDILRFIGAVTGYESYAVDQNFFHGLVNDDDDDMRLRPRFYLCGGTPGRYDACSVLRSDVAAYLRKHKADLFPQAPGLRP